MTSRSVELLRLAGAAAAQGCRRARGYTPPYGTATLVLTDDFVLSGADITAWNDLSPAGAVYSTSSTNEPTLSAINGRLAPLFGPLSAFQGDQAVGNIFAPTGYEIWSVFRCTGSSGAVLPSPNYFAASALLTGNDGWAALAIAADGIAIGHNDGGADYQATDPANYVDSTPHVVRAIYDAGAATLSIRVDGNAIFTTPAVGVPRAMPDLALVGRDWGNTHQFQGELQNWAWPSLTAGEATQFYSFLQAQYGVTIP